MGMIPTVRGWVPAAELGPTLMHEHVFLVSPDHLVNHGQGRWWDEEERHRDAVEKLKLLRASGIRTLVDQTLPGNGRDVARLARVAAEVDLHLVVTAGQHVLDDVPPHYQWRLGDVAAGTPDPLTEDFVRDVRVGVADTGVRAALLKYCVDVAGMTDGVTRVAEAVVAAHHATGVPISVHTDSASRSGRPALEFLMARGVDPQRVMISHAGDSTDLDYLCRLADTGAVLGMDRFGLSLYGDTEDRIRTVLALLERGHGDRMVLSHDTACFADWLGGDPEPLRAAMLPDWHYRFVPDQVVPALLARGASREDVDRMLVHTPRRLLEGPDGSPGSLASRPDDESWRNDQEARR